MKEERHPLEWVMLAASSLVVLMVFGYLVFLAVREERMGELPVLEVTCSQSERSSDGQFRVKVTVNNRGLRTAEHVKGEATLEGAAQPEKVEFELDRLASEATQSLYVHFQEDPGQPGRKAEGRITSFQVP